MAQIGDLGGVITSKNVTSSAISFGAGPSSAHPDVMVPAVKVPLRQCLAGRLPLGRILGDGPIMIANLGKLGLLEGALRKLAAELPPVPLAVLTFAKGIAAQPGLRSDQLETALQPRALFRCPATRLAIAAILNWCTLVFREPSPRRGQRLSVLRR